MKREIIHAGAQVGQHILCLNPVFQTIMVGRSVSAEFYALQFRFVGTFVNLQMDVV